MPKSLTRSALESPSTISSISTETPQIELRANSPRKSPEVNRIQTLTPNKSIKNLPIQSPVDQTSPSPRLFIALFDYDPQAMSPNQDSEEELPFKQGQIIKVKEFLRIRSFS